MRLAPTPIAGVWEVRTRAHRDERGSFARLFCAEAFARAGALTDGERFVQVNHSVTLRRGTVRGLHLQRAPSREAKLVTCLAGRVFDVAVDLRPGSPTRGRWHGLTLSADDGDALLIPPGCAHGFQALTDDARLLYQHTAAWAPELEDGVRHDDPRLAIAWPLPVALVSARDAALPSLDARDAALPSLDARDAALPPPDARREEVRA
jgi:dTDP-4-dehydrorhamnose 3,5-epimerase